MKTIDMDSIYRDQAIVRTAAVGYRFFTAYTQYGIKKMDQEISQRIMNKQGTEEELITEVKRNKHFHKMIKDNLISNIKRVFSE
jgi:hypothetical protein